MSFDDEMQGMLDEVAATFGRLISIRRVTGRSVNALTGAVSITDTKIDVTAHRLSIDQARVVDGSTEEVRYSVRRSELSFVPSKGDRVQDAELVNAVPVTRTRQILEVDTQCNGLEYVLFCGGSAKA